MMKQKMILGAALCATMLFGGAATAMAQDCNAAKDCKKDCKKECKAEGKECKDGKQCKALCPFEGLNLTDAQKIQIEQVCKDSQAARQQQKQVKAQDKAKKGEARQAARREQLAKIKAILTPEQYVTFLENSFVQSAPKAQQKGKAQGPRGQQKGQPRGQRGQCPQAQQAAQQ